MLRLFCTFFADRMVGWKVCQQVLSRAETGGFYETGFIKELGNFTGCA